MMRSAKRLESICSQANALSQLRIGVLEIVVGAVAPANGARLGDDFKFRLMSLDRVRDRYQLADEEMPRSMQHKVPLLLRRLP